MLNVVIWYIKLDFPMTNAEVKKQKKRNKTLKPSHFTDQVVVPFNIQTTLTLNET